MSNDSIKTTALIILMVLNYKKTNVILLSLHVCITSRRTSHIATVNMAE